MSKLKDKNGNVKQKYMWGVIGILAIAVIVLAYFLVKNKKETRQAANNSYNMAFYELVDYVQNVETYLAKSLISSTICSGVLLS